MHFWAYLFPGVFCSRFEASSNAPNFAVWCGGHDSVGWPQRSRNPSKPVHTLLWRTDICKIYVFCLLYIVMLNSLLQVICLPTGPNVQRLNSSRCCAFSLSFPYPSSIIQSMSFCLGLPLPLFPSILPSIISLCRELPLRMRPIQFLCLVLIRLLIFIYIMILFCLCSLQLWFALLLLCTIYYCYSVIFTWYMFYYWKHWLWIINANNQNLIFHLYRKVLKFIGAVHTV